MNPETFGNRLRRLRKARNLSQAKFAKAVGFSVSYISFLESGIRTPSPAALHRLAAFLDVDPTFLRHGDRVQQALKAVLERREEQHRHAVQVVDLVFAKANADDVVTCESHTLSADGREITTLTLVKRQAGEMVGLDVAVPVPRAALSQESLTQAAGQSHHA
ncbi:helix-turn-helix domain-containing protein [Nonomuraea sp. NPDC049400]|uniref:helix-turn-helix domain-containing protein n=1 Tax=Nonomuraea sp. NPDC049400 TaxID=3364352 RepID=UPI003787EDC7